MNIILKSIKIKNFKGISDLEIPFYEKETTISGQNASGKSTISDAFHFVLFNKNSHDEAKFNIKNTKDRSKNRQDHEVEAILVVDGSEVKLSKIYREKWVKRHGSETSEMTGHETLYSWNEVPLSKAEYEAKVNGIIKEELFKLLSNTTYFNSLGWKVQREILWKLVPEISDEEVGASKKEFTALLDLIKGKTIAEYKLEVAGKRKKLNDQLKEIPVQIAEATRNRPEVEEWAELSKELETSEESLKKITEALTNRPAAAEQKNEAKIELSNNINDLKLRISQVENSIRVSHSTASQKLIEEKRLSRQNSDQVERDITDLETKITRIKIDIQDKENELVPVRQAFGDIQEEWFDKSSDKLECPTCGQPFKADHIETLADTFEKSKKERFDALKAKGAKLKGEKEGLIAKLSEEEAKIEPLNVDQAGYKAEFLRLTTEGNAVKSLEDTISGHGELKILKSDLEKNQSEFDAKYTANVQPEITEDPLAELKQKSVDVSQQISSLKIRLSKKKDIEKVNTRIAELEASEKKISGEIAQLEKSEFTIMNFEKAKSERIEENLNSLFEHTKFKLFDVQVNGAISETCEATYLSVPYSDLNTAGRVLVSLDIIDTLSRIYDTRTPVFIDNSESSNEIPSIDSQIIKLKVSTDKQLVVS